MSFIEGLMKNGHRPVTLSYPGQPDLVICTSCGRYVQEKKKSIVQECSKLLTEADSRALSRCASGLHPDRMKGGRIGKCFDEVAKRVVSFAALLPTKSAKPPRVQCKARR